MENQCIKSEPEEETSEEGLFVIQGIKIEEDEQNSDDIKLEPEENDFHKEDVFSLEARNEENRDSSCTEKKFQVDKSTADRSRYWTWRQRVKAEETPEEAALRQARAAAQTRRSRQSKLARLSSEERESLRLQNVSRVQQIRLRQQATETPEKAALRRAKAAAQKQRSRQSKLARLSSEEREFQRIQDVSRVKQIRLVQQATESPEEAALRRAKAAAQKQRSRQSKLARLSSEERESLRLQNVSRVQQIRLCQQATETAEETAVRRSKAAAQTRFSRELRRSAIPNPDNFNESQVPSYDCDAMNVQNFADEKSADVLRPVLNETEGQEILQFSPDLKVLLSEGLSSLLTSLDP